MLENPVPQISDQNGFPQDILHAGFEAPQNVINLGATPQRLQNLIDTIQKPIETQKDLDQLLEMLSLASPEFAAPLIMDARNHVPIQIGTISVAIRSTDQITHRPTTYASKVTIAKGTKTGVFDVIHELRHAVPLTSQDQDVNINPKGQNREQLETAIKQMSYYDEATSIEAEIKLMEALESLGVDIAIYEKLRPGIRKVYSESGVIGLSQQLPELVPHYKDYYDDFSRRFADALESEAATKETQWTDSGVEIKAGDIGLNLQVDPERLLAKLAHINRDSLPDQVKEFVTGATGLLEQFPEKKRAQVVKEEQIKPEDKAKKELPNLVFAPRPEPENKRQEVITESPERTQYRVDIAGKFADFLKQAKTANRREQAANFDEMMAFAEHAYGTQSSTLYIECYEMLKTVSKERDNSDRIKKLGFSLLKAGYASQAHELLTYYADSHGANLGLEKIGELSAELIEAGKSDIALRLVGEARKRLTGLEGSFLPKWYLQHYIGDEGYLTDKGKELLDAFVKTRQGKIISSREFHDYILELHKQGEYVLEKDWAKYVLNSPPTHEEKDYYEYLAKLSSAGSSFTKAANLLDTDSQQAKDYSDIAKEAYRLSIFGAKQRFVIRMQEWEDKFEGTHYDPQKGLPDFVSQILAHPKSPKEYDFDEYAAGECSGVLRDVFSDKSTFAQGLELLYSLDEGLKKTSLFEYASKHIPQNLDPAVLDQFVNQWQHSLSTTCTSLETNNFIEVTNRFGNREDWIMGQNTGVKPANPKDIHLYFQQSLLMAQMLLQRPEQQYREHAISIIEQLPQSDRLFFNPHEYISPSD
jgi:hypothetical protein